MFEKPPPPHPLLYHNCHRHTYTLSYPLLSKIKATKQALLPFLISLNNTLCYAPTILYLKSSSLFSLSPHPFPHLLPHHLSSHTTSSSLTTSPPHLLPPSPLYSPLPQVVPPQRPRLLRLKVRVSPWRSRREISGEEVPMEATPCSDITNSNCIVLFCACNVDVNTALYQTISHLTKFETSHYFYCTI